MKVGARPFRNAQDSIVVLILRRITKSRQRLNIAMHGYFPPIGLVDARCYKISSGLN